VPLPFEVCCGERAAIEADSEVETAMMLRSAVRRVPAHSLKLFTKRARVSKKVVNLITHGVGDEREIEVQENILARLGDKAVTRLSISKVY
jgi:hypothetical protein